MKHKTGRKLLRFLLTLALVMTVMLPSEVATAVIGSKITIYEAKFERSGSDTELIVITRVRDVGDQHINTGTVSVYLNDTLYGFSPVENGMSSGRFEVTDLSPGDYYVRVSYHDNSGDYADSQNEYYDNPIKLAHTHSFTYSASGDTITATCSDTAAHAEPYTAALTIKPPANLVYDNKAKAATVEGTIPDVTTPDIMYEGRNGTTYEKSATAPTEMGDYTASVTLTNVKTAQSENGTVTASVEFTIKDTSYTIIIPATLDVENAGWNATAGITASGAIAEDKKLTVTAESENGWKLKDGDNTVDYYLATAEGGAKTTAWEFTAEELAAGNGTTKTMGAVVEEYINKPAGDYTDTVTFTAKVAYSPRTYHELKSGDVLRVGDTVDDPNTEYNFPGGSFKPSFTYTLLRADITLQGHSPAVTEKDDGAYYVFKAVNRQYGYEEYTVEVDAYDHFFKLVFEATSTSDGLVITQPGGSWNIAVHEP